MAACLTEEAAGAELDAVVARKAVFLKAFTEALHALCPNVPETPTEKAALVGATETFVAVVIASIMGNSKALGLELLYSLFVPNLAQEISDLCSESGDITPG